jgi:1-acyl-sn-glycerol-3-phosphate acyltransferase
MLYKVSRSILAFFFRWYFDFQVQGKEVIPQHSPFILASNHISNLDPPLIGVAVSPVRVVFLAKQELFHIPLLGWWLTHVGALRLTRDQNDAFVLRQTIKALKKETVMVFPQGTRSGDLSRFKQGVGFLQKKTALPVIAAKISGTDVLLPKGRRFPRRGRILVRLSRVSGILPSDSYEEITRKIMETIEAM